jgi:hypothetical protein
LAQARNEPLINANEHESIFDSRFSREFAAEFFLQRFENRKGCNDRKENFKENRQ